MNGQDVNNDETELERSIATALAKRVAATTITRWEWTDEAGVNAVVSIGERRTSRARRAITAVTTVAAVGAGVMVWNSLDDAPTRKVQVGSEPTGLTADVFELQTGGPMNITETQSDGMALPADSDRTVRLLCQSEIAADGSCRARFLFNVRRGYTARTAAGDEFLIEVQSLNPTPISVLERGTDEFAQRRGTTAARTALANPPAAMSGFIARLMESNSGLGGSAETLVGLVRDAEQGSAIISFVNRKVTDADIADVLQQLVVRSEKAVLVGEQIAAIAFSDSLIDAMPIYRPLGHRNCMSVRESEEATDEACLNVSFSEGQIFVPGRTGASVPLGSPLIAVGPKVARLDVVNTETTDATPLVGDVERFGFRVPVNLISSLISEGTSPSGVPYSRSLRALIAYDNNGSEIDRVTIDQPPNVDPSMTELASGTDWSFGTRKNDAAGTVECEFAVSGNSITSECGGIFAGHERVAIMSPLDTDHVLIGGKPVPVTARADQLLALSVIDAPSGSIDISAIGVDGTVLRLWQGVTAAETPNSFESTPDSMGIPSATNAVK